MSADLIAEIEAQLPTTGAHAITGQKLRTVLEDVVGNTVADVSVRTFGAKGDGVTDDTAAIQAAIDYCFGPASSPNGVNAWLNKPLYFPPGRYMISAPLNLTQVLGGIISGAGRFATRITQATPGASLFVTNGFEYTKVGNMLLTGGDGGVCFDLDWDNNGIALQSNTFSNIRFEGGAYGLRIGNTGFMGSENLIQNCFFSAQSVSGLSTQNFNSLQNTVIGGNFANCARGIDVYRGGVPVIVSVGFQANTDFDIYITNSAHVGMVVSGCRTESVNFIRCGAAPGVSLINCTQRNATSGVFADVSAGLNVDGCWSDNGQIVGGSSSVVSDRYSQYGRADYLASTGRYFPVGALIAPPAITGTISIVGAAQVGQTLTLSGGTWAGQNYLNYSWNTAGILQNSTNSTYTVLSRDVGFPITCSVSGVNYGGTTMVVTAPTANVIP